ncbi:hypothetical protein F4859DRAFT_498802 [Xylaria cf. heliscus]|nr:hypothetical protein F4859DRAFT_498802 [Xylaria cf. heliscus]
MNMMLKEPDPEKKRKFTQRWLKNMERHLNIMIITSSVVCSIISSAFSWATFSKVSSVPTCPQIVKATWYSAILLSVSSTAAASQQITIIHRLDLYPEGVQMIHQLLGEYARSPRNGIQAHEDIPAAQVLKLRPSQAVLWQIPVMLLNGSLYLFTVGLCILVYWDFTNASDASVQAVQIFGAVFFSSCAICGIVPWGISSIGLYH